MSVAVGVDACKKGWVAVALRERGLDVHFLPDIARIAELIPDAAGIAIDIPIGLPDNGQREADRLAKRRLGARQSSLFITPVRAALEADNHAAASEISVQLTGGGLSQQSFALRSKILAVEAWIPNAPCEVWEVHPEVSFTLMLGHPAGASKHSWAGMVERREALHVEGIDLDQVDASIGSKVGVDDLLDAAAAAWSARRLLAGAGRSFPDPPEIDSAGRQVAIWA